MKKFLVFLLAMSMLSITACGGTAKKLVGTWSRSGERITLYSDGSFSLDGESGDWSVVNDDELKLTIDGSIETYTIVSVDGSNLTLGLGNSSYTFTKE